MWDIVWVSPQGHRSVSVSCHFLLQAPQCPCSVWKRFTRDHCCRGRSKPGCRIVGSHTRWELTTWADFQLNASINFLCQLVASPATAVSLMSVVAMVGWGYQAAFAKLSCLTIFSTILSVSAFLRRAGSGSSKLESTGSHGRGVEWRVLDMRRMVEFNCTSTWPLWAKRDQTGCSTLLLSSKVPEQMTAQYWCLCPRRN